MADRKRDQWSHKSLEDKLIGTLGGILRSTSKPSYSVLSQVKNPALQGNIDSLLGDYKTSAAQGNAGLGDFITKYMGNQPQAQQQTNQEVGAINQFYNGSMSNQLAQLRASRQKAVTDAANVASQQAIQQQNRSRVAGSGGLGSFDTRMTMANLTPIRTQAALDNANQERQDLGYVTGNQLGLTGQRQGLETSQAEYGLLPGQLSAQMIGQRTNELSGISNLDQANKFYGLQQKPNVAADISDSVDQGILNAAAIYSSMGGGMGGIGGGKSRGGLIRGPGTETSDSIPARLSAGEFVVPAEASRIPGILPLLERIRHIALMHRVHVMGFSEGGPVIDVHAAVSPWGSPVSPGMIPVMMPRSRYNDGGMVYNRLTSGYRDGGPVLLYADGGLAGSAQQLGARAMADLTPQWSGPTMIGENAPSMGFGGGGGGGGGGFNRRAGIAAPEMPPFADTGRNQYFQPSNYQDVSPQWQAYGNAWSNYYSNPASPGYVAPGTFE